MKRASSAALLAFSVFLFLAIAIPGTVSPQRSAPQAAADGKRIFNQSCLACHDTLGTATKPGAKLKNYYRRQPRPTDATVSSIIRQGKGKMPAFSTLNKTQVDDLVAYIKTL